MATATLEPLETAILDTAALHMANQSTTRTVLPGTDRIVLTGFMGSGKTTVGALLAERLGWKFIDLDHEIERREGRSVPRIFAESGEAYFRHAESAALAAVLGRKRIVLALGGGAPEELGNRLLLEQTPRTSVVYLAAPFTHLVARCQLQIGATERPVLADLSVAELRFTTRRTLYERMATCTVETTPLTPDEAAEEVERILKSTASASA